MKQLLSILLFLLPLELLAQSAPSGYTTNFGLRKYAQGANPGADSLNANWTAIDFLSGWTRSGAGLNLWTSQTQPKVHIRTLAGDTTGTRLLNVYGDAWSSGNWFSNVVSGSLSPGFAGQRALTGPAAVTSGTKILSLLGQGYNGTSYVTGGEIAYKATETFSGSARGTEIEFYTTPNASTTNTLALTLGQDQSANFEAEVGVGGTLSVTGATTLAAMSATTGTFSSTITVNNANGFIISAAAGGDRGIFGQTAGVNRWKVILGDATAESGSDVGSDLLFQSRTDAGAVKTNVLRLTRAGLVTLDGNLTVTGATTLAGVTSSSGGWFKGTSWVGQGKHSPVTDGLSIDHDGSSALGIIVGDITTVSNNTGIFLRTTGNAYVSQGTGGVMHVGGNTSGTNAITIAQSSGNLTVTGDAAINGGDFTSTATTFNLLNATVTTGNLFGAATTVNLGAAGGVLNSSLNLLPNLTDTYDLGSPEKLWRKGWLSEMQAILFAENTISLLGGWFYVTKGQGTVEEDVDGSETAIDFGSGASLAENDFVIFRNSGEVEYMKIGTNVSGNNWNVTRDVDGSGANTWPQGTPFANFGQAGNGRIELNAFDTPRLSIMQQGGAFNLQTEVIRLGDLNGNWGYAAQTWGLAVGKYEAGFNSITVDTANGIRMFDGTDEVSQWLNDSLVLGSRATENIHLSPTTLSFRDGTETTHAKLAGSVLTLGDEDGGEYATFDGTNGIKLFGGGVESVNIKNDGTATIGKSLTAGSGDDVAIISGDDATYRFWAGDATAADAEFKVEKDGSVIATDMTAGGFQINTSIVHPQTGFTRSAILGSSSTSLIANSPGIDGDPGTDVHAFFAQPWTTDMSSDNLYGYFVFIPDSGGNANQYGVHSTVNGATTNSWGVHATATAGTPVGVYGEAVGSAVNAFGLRGKASGATNNYAGYFEDGSIFIKEKVTTYNNIATEGYGVPAIVDLTSATGQTASIAATALSNTTATGIYRVSVYLEAESPQASGSTVFATIHWEGDSGENITENTATITLTTDDDENTHKTFFINHTGAGAVSIQYSTTYSGADDSYLIKVVAERLN